MDPPPTTASATPSDDELIAAARAAQERAHSPYSGVRVGAALVADDGRVFTGCNVENASLGLTMCAERTALGRAVSEGARAFRACVISTDRARPLFPCGACRQALREFGRTLRILCVGAGGARVERTLEEMLPDSFGPEDLDGGG